MTTEKIPKWESELWSYMSSGDGINCPLYDACQTRLDGEWCFSDNQELIEEFYGTHVVGSLSDEDELERLPSLFEGMLPTEWNSGPIFQLVDKLANKYLKKAKLDHPPVMTEVIRHFEIIHQIEIRLLPLKAYHGAISRVEDVWVIHLNKKDKPAKQRMTLFHEVFHILAHWRASPVFRKRGGKEGLFNEMLADYFAACLLMPEIWVKEKWVELKDLKQMAEVFQVTEVSMWIRLKSLGLI